MDSTSQPTNDPKPPIIAPKADEEIEEEEVAQAEEEEPPFSIFSDREKKLVILTVSFAGLISPLSTAIILPALGTLATDLKVSVSLINLTVTVYMIFQALSPTLFGNFSDLHGRRPAYLLCYTIYTISSLALALQSSYPALLILRMLQSCGSSATVALGTAVVADVSTRAERGKYIAYASMGMILGPAIGPLVGGLIDTYAGWRWIFWTLMVFAGVMGLVTGLFLPETCRAVVGDGGLRPQKWNRTVVGWVRDRKREEGDVGVEREKVDTRLRPIKRPNPIASLRIILEKEGGAILSFGALLYAGFYVVMATLTTQLQSKYGLSTLQVGLCYLPLGVGCLLSRFTVGVLLDRNYKRHTRLLDAAATEKNKKEDPLEFPIEKVRLQIGIPAVYASATVIVIYGWVLEYRTNLAGPLIILFLVGNFATGAFNIFSTLIVDINPEQPATAVAANNLFRCLLGAAFTAFSQPLINAIGIGWVGTLIAFLWLLASPILWAVYYWGRGWRREKKARLDEHLQKEAEEAASRGEVPVHML